MSDAAAAVVDPAGGSTSTTRATRAALEYLQLSGATPISIRATESGGSKTRFGKVDPNAAIVVWCEETRARPVIRLARRYAGPGASVTAASAALRKAAGDMRIVLTPDATAMERATAQARRLDQFIEDLHARGNAPCPRCGRPRLHVVQGCGNAISEGIDPAAAGWRATSGRRAAVQAGLWPLIEAGVNHGGTREPRDRA